jgi:hypothetical protein
MSQLLKAMKVIGMINQSRIDIESNPAWRFVGSNQNGFEHDYFDISHSDPL